MIRKAFAVAFLLMLFAVPRPAIAAVTDCTTLDCVPRVPTVHYVRNTNLTTPDGYISFYLVSYGNNSDTVTPQDGAAGLFVRADCGGATDNGGSVLQDSAHTCFFRQNLNGDLRQWGLTPGSPFDADTNPTTVSDATPTIAKAFNAVASTGIRIKTLHTMGVSVKIGTRLQIPPGGGLTCDTPAVKFAANAQYNRLPGSLIIAHASDHSVYIDAENYGVDGSGKDVKTNDVEIFNCAAIIPDWYFNPSGFSVPAASYADLETIRKNMIANADFAIEYGLGAKIHDLSILGFDNCLYAENAPRSSANTVYMDCPIGLYESDNNGQGFAKDLDVEPVLTKDTPVRNEEYWDITNIVAKSGTGECQISLRAVQGSGTAPLFSVSDLQSSATDTGAGGRGDPTSYPAWVSGLMDPGRSCGSAGTGQFGNDPAWVVSVDSKSPNSGNYLLDTATVTLVGSHYASSTAQISTTGSWQANSGVIRVGGTISNMAAGMRITSSDPSWPAGVVRITGIVQRCTGPDPDDGYNGCLIVSPAPLTASAGEVALSTFNDKDTFTPSSDSCNGQGAGYCFYYNAAERYVAGFSDAGTATSRLPASRGGHLAAGILLDSIAGLRAINTNVYGHYYNIATFNSEGCAFLQINGDDNGELNPGNSAGVYTSGDSRTCSFYTKASGKPGSSIVQDTFGTTPNPAIPSITITGMSALGAYGLGTVTSGSSTAAWPQRGTLHLCKAVTGGGDCDPGPASGHYDEYVSYHKGSGTSIVIDVRARFGTFPRPFPAGTVTGFSTIVGSGSSKHFDKTGSSLYSSLSDGTTTGTGNAFEILHGAATLLNLRTTTSGHGFVSHNTSGVSLEGVNEDNTTIAFEDDSARMLTTVSPDSDVANFVQPGMLNLPLSYWQWYGAPQAATDLSGIALNKVGQVTVQDTTNWPLNGVLLADSEYIAYHVEDGTHVIVDQRAQCGSTAATHADGAIVVYMNVLYGCPGVGAGAAQFAIDGAGNVSFAQSALAHGQVYMNLNAPNVQLCPANGKGLIISGVMRAVPKPCAIVPTTQTQNNHLNYVYAMFHQVAVTSIGNDGSGHARLYVTGANDFYNTSPISCMGMTGTPAADVAENSQTDTGTDGTGLYIDLLNVSFAASGTGSCSYVGLDFDSAAPALGDNGVEIKSGTGGQAFSLVGLVYAAGSHSVSDTATKRDVASWFNRKTKTCIQSGLSTSTVSTTSTAFVELDSGKECEFVAWADSDLAWTSGARGYNNTNGDGAALSAGFDSGSGQTEVADMQYATGTGANTKTALVVSGSHAAFGSDGKHYITVVGKANAGGTASFDATATFVEVRVPQ